MRSFLAGIVLVVALFVAGCGGSSSTNSTNSSGNGEAVKPAQQVLADAVKAAEAASSLHVSGQISAVGQQIGIDMTIVKGKGATGSMTLGGQKVDLVVIGNDGYMKAGAAFWTQFGGSSGSTIAQMLQGKWVKFPMTNTQFAELTSLTDSKSLFDQLGSVSGTPKNKGVTTYQGQSVVEIDNQGKLYVASSGTPYPVAAVATGAGVGGTITFGSWNKSATLTAPAGALDFSTVQG
jgi:hypothetical protein